jgi:hypothetical protein
VEAARRREAEEGENEEALKGHLRPTDHSDKLISQTALRGEAEATEGYGNSL